MKKILISSILCLSGLAHAHDLWVAAPNTQPANQILRADLAYGDNFPAGGSIPEARAKIFKPLELLDSKGKLVPLKLTGDNYQYSSTNKIKSGTYHILATYKPTFWLKDANGKWFQDKNLSHIPDASHCEQSQMFAKRLLVVGNEYDEITATVPVGQLLEIVPLANPHEVKIGGVLPLQVWYQGKPLAGATVTATSDVYLAQDPDGKIAHREIQAYSGKTDSEGRTNFIPLLEGEWKIRVQHKADFEDKSVCQHHALYATYMMTIGTQRAAPAPAAQKHDHHHHDHHHDHHHHDHKH